MRPQQLRVYTAFTLEHAGIHALLQASLDKGGSSTRMCLGEGTGSGVNTRKVCHRVAALQHPTSNRPTAKRGKQKQASGLRKEDLATGGSSSLEVLGIKFTDGTFDKQKAFGSPCSS